MVDKISFIKFDTVFPQSNTIKTGTRQEVIELAKKVAESLKREKEQLVKEQQENNITSGIFSAS